MEFNLGDHQLLLFTEEDGSAASIFDKIEGPYRKKFQCEVKFVDAEVGHVPSSLMNVFKQQKQEKLAREKRLREKRLLLDKTLSKYRRIH
jgi:hypothetical protein